MSNTILREYQKALKAEVFQAWKDGHTNVLVQSHTGSGKTVLLTDIVKTADVPTVIIAHRLELVSQLSLALARAEMPHALISPTQSIAEIIKLHLQNDPRHYFSPTSQVIVASVDTLIRRNIQWSNRIKLVVIDECFPAGTLVDGLPIDTLKVGDEVTAFNEDTKLLEKRKIIKTYRRIIPKDMVRLKMDGVFLNCTRCHPFYTQRGWINAEDLRTTDFVLRLVKNTDYRNNRESEISTSKKWQNILFKKMWIPISSIFKNQRMVKNNKKTRNPMCNLRGNVRSFRFQIPTIFSNPKSILQQGMQPHIPSTNIFSYFKTNQRKIRSSVYDSKQYSADLRITTKSFTNFEGEGAQTQNSRRKWETPDKSRSRFIFTFKEIWLYFTARHIDPSTETKRIPLVLQTRFGEFLNKIGNRSRRQYPQWAEKFRSEERSMLKWVRMESIEIQKSRNSSEHSQSGPRDYVYNIEVEGLNTYLANGIVVHNCSHVLRKNKWGKVCDMFPNANALLVTATPMRADGRGLGREADGVADHLIEGPSMRKLIDEGYLSEYRIFAPPNSLDVSKVSIAPSGDYSPDPLRKAVSKAHITGDIVDHFKRYAGGKRGITFAVSVDAAKELSDAYNQAGVPAVCLHADSGISERASVMRKFREGTIQQLVNVDILSEGVDVPEVTCVSLARPTMSYGLHMQQIGRALRPAEGKKNAIILDHVGNVTKHGLPDEPRVWTLAAQDKKSRGKPGTIALRTCLNPICMAVFPRNLDRCTYCGHPIPLPKERSRPDQVEGDLKELTPEGLKRITEEITRIESAPRIPHGVSGIIASSIVKKHHDRRETLSQLKELISNWAGVYHHKGESDSEIQRRFFLTFGVDVLTAQTLSKKDAESLISRITN